MKSILSTTPRQALIAIGVVVALAGSASAVYAHDAMNQNRMTDRFDYIFTQLNLTDAQRAEVVDIMTTQMAERREQHREQRDSGAERPTAEERQALRDAARTALTDELGTVLQADQVEGLITYLEAHQPRGGKGMHGSHRGGRYAPAEQSTDAQ
ncbi:Spy/CpxP family protein refolding chaperone [Saccharospirillum alexandrii]|uniref:Spy/CpxP family protein refolding chaperone n=1 Tax=Saccharospirillum alexandrii TaxID=2448477 RepID=UPI00373633D9